MPAKGSGTPFWDRVSRARGPDACWPWQGYRDRHGYGRIRRSSRTELAHRVALSLNLGRPLSEGCLVLHSCDNPPCCNPSHLSEGSQARNMRDCSDRGRARGLSRPGIENPHSKLTDLKVIEIYCDPSPHREIALRHHVSKTLISNIKRGLTWAHVTGSVRHLRINPSGSDAAHPDHPKSASRKGQ